MVGSELGDQVGGVLRRVHRQLLRDGQQRARELSDRQLLPRTLQQEHRSVWTRAVVSSVRAVARHILQLLGSRQTVYLCVCVCVCVCVKPMVFCASVQGPMVCVCVCVCRGPLECACPVLTRLVAKFSR